MTNGRRVLLAGDAAARPLGLERALTRAGFLVSEAQTAGSTHETDAILITLSGSSDTETRAAVAAARPDSPPVILVFAAEDVDAPAAALALGADDALAAPVHLPELCARLHARIRDRQCPRGTTREDAVRRSLDSLIGEGRMTLRPDEVVLVLVRRLARAFDLVSCSFVAVDAERSEARVIAEVGPGPVAIDSAGGFDPADHPEVAEAIRSRRVAARSDGRDTALPALAGGRVHGVLVIRRREEHPGLSPAQLQFAESLAEAAARALDSAHGESNGNGASPGPRATSAPVGDTLDHRLQEEFERARRYSLSFSLILLDFGSRGDISDDALSGAAQILRQELRLPDYLSRYGGGELAIVLPETGLDGARRSVARLRDQLATHGVEVTTGGSGFSAGIVTYPHPAVSQADDMFALVEAALARGKAQIGERVGVAD